MKYKATIVNEVNGKEYGASFNSIQEREEYVNRVINKKVLGLKERQVLKSELPENLISRVISEVTKSVTISSMNEEGEEIEEVLDLVYCNLKSDFLVTTEDVNNYKEMREKEYPSIQEVIHALLDGGLEDIQARRALTKAKYPKD